MSQSAEPFFGWPGWRHLRFAGLLSLLGLLWFLLIYDGANALTAHRDFRVRVYLDAELHIPFVPAAVIVYMSIYPLFLAAPFILRQRRDFLALAMTLNTVILIAGICFLLFPAQVGYPPPSDLGAFAGLYRFASELCLTYNLVPSLHVALTVVCVAVFAARGNSIGKLLLWIWAAAVAASTLLIHKHHVLDVLTGFILAWAAYKQLFTRFQSSAIEQGLPGVSFCLRKPNT